MSQRKRFAAVLPIVELRELYQDKFSDSIADLRYNPDAHSSCRVLIDMEWPTWAGDDVTAIIERELQHLPREAIS